jgi:hypothetical protein
MLKFVQHFLCPRTEEQAEPATLLFLDIDGVLNSQQTREGGDHMPAEALLDTLARVVHAASACIVLSSTWRLEEHTNRAVQLALACHQLRLIGSTPDLAIYGDRVDEILSWIRTHPEHRVRAWVALDDMDLTAMNPKLDAAHFVRTDDTVGLTDQKADEAIRKLAAQCQWVLPQAPHG